MNNLGDHFNCQRRFAPTLFTWLERSIHLVGIRTIIDRAKLGRTPLSSHQSETYRYPISKSGSMATSSARDEDVFEYRRGFVRVLDLPYNRQELIINLAPAAALFNKLLESSEDYAGEVPIIHQAVAVKAAIDALDGAFEEQRDPN